MIVPATTIDLGFALWQPWTLIAFFLQFSYIVFGVFRFSPSCNCCEDPCSQCQSGTTPEEVQIDVPAGTFTTDNCAGNCTDGEGTFILPKLATNPCIFGSCDTDVTLPRQVDCTGVGGNKYCWLVQINSGNVLARFDEDQAGLIGTIFRVVQAGPHDCSAFSALSLDFFSNSSSPLCESTAGKTVEVTSL